MYCSCSHHKVLSGVENKFIFVYCLFVGGFHCSRKYDTACKKISKLKTGQLDICQEGWELQRDGIHKVTSLCASP